MHKDCAAEVPFVIYISDYYYQCTTTPDFLIWTGFPIPPPLMLTLGIDIQLVDHTAA